MKTLTFKSTTHPDQSIEVREYDNGLYYIPAAIGHVPPEENIFNSIEEIEKVLNDTLVLLRPIEERKH